MADGICGPCCQHELGLRPLPDLEHALDVQAVRHLFPATRPSGIVRHLSYLAAALAAFGLVDRPMALLALAVIRAETEGFVPIGEAPSHWNTLPGMAPFSAYEGRFGNRETGDGARYRGRGFVQLTGRSRYRRAGTLLGIDLEALPELANAPEVAACLLAARIRERADECRAALARGDARRAFFRTLAAVIDHGDGHGPLLLERFGFGRRHDGAHFGGFEKGFGFHDVVHPSEGEKGIHCRRRRRQGRRGRPRFFCPLDPSL